MRNVRPAEVLAKLNYACHTLAISSQRPMRNRRRMKVRKQYRSIARGIMRTNIVRVEHKDAVHCTGSQSAESPLDEWSQNGEFTWVQVVNADGLELF